MGSVSKNVPGCCCSAAGPVGTVNCSWCTQLIPSTLHLTGRVGTIPLINGSTTGGSWIGCGTFVTPGQVDPGSGCVDATVTTPIQYTLRCPTTYEFSSNRKWILDLLGVGALFGGGHHYGPGTCAPFAASAGQCGGYGPVGLGSYLQDGGPQPTACRPVNLSFTIVSGNGNCQHCETVTVTE